MSGPVKKKLEITAFIIAVLLLLWWFLKKKRIHSDLETLKPPPLPTVPDVTFESNNGLQAPGDYQMSFLSPELPSDTYSLAAPGDLTYSTLTEPGDGPTGIGCKC